MKIKFGTSGWRAVMSEDFTFDNVRLLSQAVANYLKKTKKDKKGIIVAHDGRFLSADFAKEAAQVIASNDIEVYFPKRPTPIPAVAFSIRHKKLAGAVIISASHNPPEYNGFKFSSEYGGPASKEVTRKIEKEVAALSLKDVKKYESKIEKRIKLYNPVGPYLRQLRKILNVELMKKHKLRIAIDCMNGIITGYLDRFLEEAKFKIKTVNQDENPSFGGRNPDPLPENLKELIKEIRREKYDLGLTVDGDSDRFGVVDGDGKFISPNQIISLIFYYLVNAKNGHTKVARSISTTHLVDKIAKDYGIEVVETPIGFKYLGHLLDTGEFILAAEESGGLSIGGHLPDKDGILADLLVVEAMAYFKKPLKEILREIYKRYGKFFNKRINLKIDKSRREEIMGKLAKRPPLKIAGEKVVKINKLDGYKFILDGGDWVMFRSSGTEPVIRCYIESRTRNTFKKIQTEALKVIGENKKRI